MPAGRPTENGLKFFYLDVELDEKFELLEAEFGITGFAVMIKLYQRIYSKGFYCQWSDEVALLFGRKLGLGGSAVSEIVMAAIRRNLFSKDKFEKYGVLTSSGIQKNYFDVVTRRKCVEVDERYLLIDVPKNVNCVFVNRINVCINSENDDSNSKSDCYGLTKNPMHSPKESHDNDHSLEAPITTAEVIRRGEIMASIERKARDIGLIRGHLCKAEIASLDELYSLYPLDWVIEIMERAYANKNVSWNYIKYVLNKWNSQGFMDGGRKQSAVNDQTQKPKGRQLRDMNDYDWSGKK